mgnify:CR=1 FL=1
MPVPVMRSAAAAAALWLASGGPLAAQAAKPESPPAAFTTISPVFGQLVAFSMPSNFVATFEDTKPASYTREAVPKGESVQKWSEMITLTGAKGAASAPNASAEKFAGAIAGGFQRACPDLVLKVNASQMDWEYDPSLADLGIICTTAPDRPGRRYTPLFDADLVLVCSPGLVDGPVPLTSPRDLGHMMLSGILSVAFYFGGVWYAIGQVPGSPP